jgi:hypothetical protein
MGVVFFSNRSTRDLKLNLFNLNLPVAAFRIDQMKSLFFASFLCSLKCLDIS